MSFSDNVHRPTTILVFLDVSETYEVCKVRRISRNIPIVSRRDGANGSSGIPCLVVARLFDAEGPQCAKGEWVIFVRVIEKVFEIRGETWAFSSAWKERMQKSLELLVFLRVIFSACGA